jgi:hypothetical protein
MVSPIERGAEIHQFIEEYLSKHGKLPTEIPPHKPKVAEVESSRQPTTIRKTRELTQARIIKRALKVGALTTVLGVAAMGQQLSLSRVSANVTVSTSLPDAPGLEGEDSVSHMEYMNSRMIRPLSQPKLNLDQPAPYFRGVMVPLVAGEFTVRTLDAQSTLANLHNPCGCYREANVPWAAKSTMKMYGYSEGVAAAYVGASYMLHRHGHERLARGVLMFDIAYDGHDVAGNYQIAGQHGVSVPVGKVVTHGK